MRNGDFERPPNVAHDRRKRKAGAESAEAERGAGRGFFYFGLNERLQESLVGYVRREAIEARKQGRADLAEHDAAKLARREDRLTTTDYLAECSG